MAGAGERRAMLAAIAATWASVWVRAFLAYGISRSIAQRSTLSAGDPAWCQPHVAAIDEAQAIQRIKVGEFGIIASHQARLRSYRHRALSGSYAEGVNSAVERHAKEPLLSRSRDHANTERP